MRFQAQAVVIVQDFGSFHGTGSCGTILHYEEGIKNLSDSPMSAQTVAQKNFERKHISTVQEAIIRNRKNSLLCYPDVYEGGTSVGASERVSSGKAP